MLVLKVNPVGKSGEIEYLNGAVPPVPVTGVNAVKLIPCVSCVVGTANVATGILAVTVMLNVELAVCGVAPLSVTVTVNVVLLNDTVGVPVI